MPVDGAGQRAGLEMYPVAQVCEELKAMLLFLGYKYYQDIGQGMYFLSPECTPESRLQAALNYLVLNQGFSDPQISRFFVLHGVLHINPRLYAACQITNMRLTKAALSIVRFIFTHSRRSLSSQSASTLDPAQLTAQKVQDIQQHQDNALRESFSGYVGNSDVDLSINSSMQNSQGIQPGSMLYESVQRCYEAIANITNKNSTFVASPETQLPPPPDVDALVINTDVNNVTDNSSLIGNQEQRIQSDTKIYHLGNTCVDDFDKRFRNASSFRQGMLSMAASVIQKAMRTALAKRNPNNTLQGNVDREDNIINTTNPIIEQAQQMSPEILVSIDSPELPIQNSDCNLFTKEAEENEGTIENGEGNENKVGNGDNTNLNNDFNLRNNTNINTTNSNSNNNLENKLNNEETTVNNNNNNNNIKSDTFIKLNSQNNKITFENLVGDNEDKKDNNNENDENTDKNVNINMEIIEEPDIRQNIDIGVDINNLNDKIINRRYENIIRGNNDTNYNIGNNVNNYQTSSGSLDRGNDSDTNNNPLRYANDQRLTNSSSLSSITSIDPSPVIQQENLLRERYAPIRASREWEQDITKNRYTTRFLNNGVFDVNINSNTKNKYVSPATPEDSIHQAKKLLERLKPGVRNNFNNNNNNNDNNNNRQKTPSFRSSSVSKDRNNINMRETNNKVTRELVNDYERSSFRATPSPFYQQERSSSNLCSSGISGTRERRSISDRRSSVIRSSSNSSRYSSGRPQSRNLLIECQDTQQKSHRLVERNSYKPGPNVLTAQTKSRSSSRLRGSESPFERLYNNSIYRAQKLAAARAHAENEELNTIRMPNTIRSRSRSISISRDDSSDNSVYTEARRTVSRSNSRDFSRFFERLEMETKKREAHRKQAEEQRKAEEQRELRNCTFKPHINQNSSALSRAPSSTSRSTSTIRAEERMEIWLKRREGKLQKMRKERDEQLMAENKHSQSTDKGKGGELTVSRACSRLYAIHAQKQELLGNRSKNSHNQSSHATPGNSFSVLDVSARSNSEQQSATYNAYINTLNNSADAQQNVSRPVSRNSPAPTRAQSRRLVDRTTLIGLRKVLRSQSRSSSTTRSPHPTRVEHSELSDNLGSSALENMIASLL